MQEEQARSPSVMHPHSHVTGSTLLAALWFTCVPTGIAPPALAEQAAPDGRLVKVVLLSRHSVRSPTLSSAELATWTASPWPVWQCDGKVCEPGQLTPRGRTLSEQMGTYYRSYLSTLLPTDRCPTAGEVYFWADVPERTIETGRALLRGFRPACDTAQYFHSALPARHDPVFHAVRHGGPCRLDAARAESEMLALAGGDLADVTRRLAPELAIAQQTLQCCTPRLCEAATAACRQPASSPNTCTLTERLPSCLVRRQEHHTVGQVALGGALRMASTFAEILLLEYANGFPANEVGWGRITREQMTQVFRLHTTGFELEQRTPYVAALQGSPLLGRMLAALTDEGGSAPGSAPAGAKLVAYVGHDTNLANLAAMLDLTWQQPGYQKNQTPPTGALIFELRQTDAGARNVHVFYDASALDDLRAEKGDRPVRTPVRVPGCGDGLACSLTEFAKLIGSKLDRSCTQ
jgi:4-phytase/acid phosphatase